MAIIKDLKSRKEAISGIESFKEKNDVHAHLYSLGAIEALIKQPGFSQLKVNYGIGANGETTSLLHGVDVNGNVMNEMLVASVVMCPPTCKPQDLT